jgi:hypothetical protein
VSYTLLLSLIEFKTLVMRDQLSDALGLLPNIPTGARDGVCRCQRGRIVWPLSGPTCLFLRDQLSDALGLLPNIPTGACDGVCRCQRGRIVWPLSGPTCLFLRDQLSDALGLLPNIPTGVLRNDKRQTNFITGLQSVCLCRCQRGQIVCHLVCVNLSIFLRANR